MKVILPTPLSEYTANAREVQARGATLDELFDDLDRQFPGLRFRVVDEQGRLRRHMNVYVNQHRTRDLSTSLSHDDELTIMQALSGG